MSDFGPTCEDSGPSSRPDASAAQLRGEANDRRRCPLRRLPLAPTAWRGYLGRAHSGTDVIEQKPCANGDGPASTRCTRCRIALCIRCAAFLVNGAPWCEPCGNDLAEQIARPWGRGAATLVVGFAAVGLLAWLELTYAWRLHHGFFGLLVFGVLLAAAKVVFPVTGAERPRIERNSASR